VVIRARELASVIAARLDQILDGLMNDFATFADQIGVLYITGGASMLNGVEAYVQSKTTVDVMYGSHAPWLSMDTPDEICAPCYASLVGTLLQGEQYRREHPDEQVEDDIIKRLKKLRKKVEEETLSIFTELENN
jgi:cell division ATPase FtsA